MSACYVCAAEYYRTIHIFYGMFVDVVVPTPLTIAMFTQCLSYCHTCHRCTSECLLFSAALTAKVIIANNRYKVITRMVIGPLDDPTWCAQSVVTDLRPL